MSNRKKGKGRKATPKPGSMVHVADARQPSLPGDDANKLAYDKALARWEQQQRRQKIEAWLRRICLLAGGVGILGWTQMLFAIMRLTYINAASLAVAMTIGLLCIYLAFTVEEA